jgi:hypothetical protein
MTTPLIAIFAPVGMARALNMKFMPKEMFVVVKDPDSIKGLCFTGIICISNYYEHNKIYYAYARLRERQPELFTKAKQDGVKSVSDIDRGLELTLNVIKVLKSKGVEIHTTAHKPDEDQSDASVWPSVIYADSINWLPKTKWLKVQLKANESSKFMIFFAKMYLENVGIKFETTNTQSGTVYWHIDWSFTVNALGKSEEIERAFNNELSELCNKTAK